MGKSKMKMQSLLGRTSFYFMDKYQDHPSKMVKRIVNVISIPWIAICTFVLSPYLILLLFIDIVDED